MPLVNLRWGRGVRLILPGLLLATGVARATPSPDRITARLVEQGFENVAVAVDTTAITVWYENRIYRYDMTAMGVAAKLTLAALDTSAGVLELVPENRGVAIVAVSAPVWAWRDFLGGRAGANAFRSELAIDVHHRRSGAPLAAHRQRSNRPYGRTDVALRPLFGFQLGAGRDPFLYTLQVAPEATVSPFAGGLLTLQAAIRIHDDQDPCGTEDPCRPPVIPGRNTLSWGGWLPAGVLSTISAGLFPGDRYGIATELGRLVWKDQLEIWAGGDVSGKLLFLEDSIEYSSLDRWAAFLAITHRFRGLDLETTVTAGRFEEEEFALKLEVARRIHEFEIGFFVATNPNSDLQFTPYEDAEDKSAAGVNLRFALPVAHYARPKVVRPTTVPDFPFTYKSTVDPVAVQITPYDNLDRLRKRLYPTFIWNEIEDLREANRYVTEDGSASMSRSHPARAAFLGLAVICLGRASAADGAPPDTLAAWQKAPSLIGMTGLINTPTADVLPSGALRLGVGWFDKEWAYHARGVSDNYHYFLSFGFVSRVEVSIRASYFPDDQLDTATGEKGTVDRGGNARLLLLTEGARRPALAIGIDDVRGTRRFHSLYAVGSKTFVIKPQLIRVRVSGGYAPDWIDAKDHNLFGGFGGGEVTIGNFGSWAIDYDTEKWNTSIRLYALRRVTAYLALLNFEGSAGGVSWTHQF